MKPEVKRKSQVGIGFAILVFAIIISYFSVEEIDTQEIPQYDIYLVIDVSGSMGTCLDGDWISTCYNVGVTNDSPITFAKKAAIEFVDTFQLDESSNHRIGLAIFHGTQYDPANPISKIIVELDNDSKKLKDGIDTLYPSGGTAMGDGISISTQSLSQNARPDVEKIIVLLSDGVSNMGSEPRLAAGIAKENNVTIFSVGYGDFADVQTLKAVASVTGGKYYDAPTGKDLARTFNEIADVLISPVSHYSSRILILLAIPVLLFIPTIERGFTTMMEKVQDKPVKRNVKKSISKIDVGGSICKKCNHTNRSTSKFCIKCGDTLGGSICKKCNHTNRSTSKFCIKCGDTLGGNVR